MSNASDNKVRSLPELLNDLKVEAGSTEDYAVPEEAADLGPFSRSARTPPTRRLLNPDISLDFEVDTTIPRLWKTLKALADMPISVQSLQTVETFARLSREMLELLGKR
jgi:hypothetical protein